MTVLVPVWARPQRVRPFVSSLQRARPDLGALPPGAPDVHVRALFVCNRDDPAEIAAVRAAGLEPLIVDWPAGSRGDYGRKINAAAVHAANNGADWLLCGADDLAFHDGWAGEAIAVADKTGALVVGTNDLGNPTVMSGVTSTHPLVHASYVGQGTLDGTGALMHAGYDHNCVDAELVETAKARRVWAFAEKARVEHLHPHWRKGRDDAVYRRGRETHWADRRLFNRRRRLWASKLRVARAGRR